MIESIDPTKITKGIIIHAVAVKTSNGALLILGPSGVGKSTLANKLSSRWETFADDYVYLFEHPILGEWFVADGKKTKSISHAHIPLMGLLRVYQSSSAQVIECTPRQTCHHLCDAVLDLEFNRDSITINLLAWFSFLADIARGYPCLNVFATLGEEITSILFDQFELY